MTEQDKLIRQVKKVFGPDTILVVRLDVDDKPFYTISPFRPPETKKILTELVSRF